MKRRMREQEQVEREKHEQASKEKFINRSQLLLTK